MEFTKKHIIRHLRDSALMGILGGVSMGYISCPECFTSFQRAFMVSAFSGSFWIFLWKGNEFIAEYLDCRTSWLEHPLRRLVVGLLAMLVYTVSITTLINYIFIIIILRREFSSEIIRDEFIPTSIIALVITLIISLFLHGREFLLSWRQAAINAEKMKTENISSRYESLKNQVNPHFLFNSLNALSNLVYENQDLAVKFIRKLSEVYRYVLDTRDKEVVKLCDELTFLDSYIFLQKIRYEENLKVNINLPRNTAAVIPPLSLQMLVENAIKHNIISEDEPLHIDLFMEGDDYIVVKNNLQKKNMWESPSGIGLSNIKSRYEYLTQKAVEVLSTSHEFLVKIPVLNFTAA
jgi:sensor histidine kinase YesM